MGGRGSRSNLPNMQLRQPAMQPQPAVPQQPLPPDDDDTQAQPLQQNQPTVDSNGFSDTDNAAYHDLYNGRQYYQQQNLDVDARTALKDYLDPNTVGGSLYNASQNMNWAISQGTPLTPQQQFMRDAIVDSMHNLGYNLNLTRYDHGPALDTILQQVGVQGGHQGLSISQLKNVLVGQTYTDNRILSTSYNNFKNASDPSTFTSREIKITYQAKASTQAMMPGIGSISLRGSGMRRGDDLGEMLLAPTGTNGGHNNYKIVDVRYTGNSARAKGTQSYHLKQIEIVVEVD